MASPGLGSDPGNSKPSGSSLKVDGSEDGSSAIRPPAEECESPSIVGNDMDADEDEEEDESPEPKEVVTGVTNPDEEEDSAESPEDDLEEDE